MKQAPDVSVCIANYDGERWLPDCIASLRTQQGEVSIEIIVHDDASNDCSVKWLLEQPDIVLIQSPTNVGFCVANNRMVDRATGRYVLLLNNDAALHPDALITLLAESSAQAPRCVLTLPQYDWNSGQLVDRGCMLDIFNTPVPNLDPARNDVGYVIGACLFVPQSLWHEVGGFPEWMDSIGEDLFFCSIARLWGYSVLACNRSGYRHRQGSSFGGNRVLEGRLNTTARRRYLSERNRLLVLYVCMPGILWWPMWMLQAFALLGEGIVLSLLRRDYGVWRDVYWRALSDATRARTELYGERARVQARRRTGPAGMLRTVLPIAQKFRLWIRHGLPTIRGAR